MTPWEVDMIVVPIPPRTFGTCLASTYVRRPGRETRLRPEMTDVRFSVYLSRMWIRSPAAPPSAGRTSKPSMYPCSVRMRAISAFSREFGITTSSWAAWMPLRIRVRKSAMGSVIDMRSPARLRHAGDEALVRELAQADPAQAELAVHGARAPAAATTRVLARLELGRAALPNDLALFSHEAFSLSPLRRDRLASERLEVAGASLAGERHPQRVEK